MSSDASERGVAGDGAGEVVDNSDERRYELRRDGKPVSFVEYRLERTTMALVHTVTEPDVQERGLATAVVRHALDDARRRNLAVLPFCEFVRGFIKGHPDYLELVPASQREQFGL